MKKLLIGLLLFASMSVHAECCDFAEYLIKEFPNRVFVERYGFDERFAIYQPSLTNQTSTVTIINCIDDNFIVEKVFDFKVRRIDRLQYSEKLNTLNVIFIDESENYGWIETEDSGYKFTLYSDPEL